MVLHLSHSKITSGTTDVLQGGLPSDRLLSHLSPSAAERRRVSPPEQAPSQPCVLTTFPSEQSQTGRFGTKHREAKLALKAQRSKPKEVSTRVSGTNEDRGWMHQV